jgi:hypothetical protein
MGRSKCLDRAGDVRTLGHGGDSLSVYSSMPSPEVQMNPSPDRPAYLATIGPPAAMYAGTGGGGLSYTVASTVF